MADVISKVSFRSPGAAVPAPDGTYPITAGLIAFDIPSLRAKYSVKYLPGVLTVGSAAGLIAFVRKSQMGFIEETGTVEFPLPVAPDDGNMQVVVIGTFGLNSAATAPQIGSVTDGTGHNFDQVGGAGYFSEAVGRFGAGDTNNETVSLSMWYRAADASIAAGTVKAAISGGGNNTFVNLYVLEYSNAAGAPITDQVKASHDLASFGVGGVAVETLPGLDLNGSTGQLAIAAFVLNSSSGDGLIPAGYTGRYNCAGGAFEADAVGVAIFDRVGLSGVGPEAITHTRQPLINTSYYAGMAAALQKG